MNNPLDFLKQNPEIAKNVRIEISAKELIAFAESFKPVLIEKGKSTEERYLTSSQFADALQISLVTLWNWDKKGITKPIRIGNKKRYRFSDIEKFAEKEEVAINKL